MPIVKLKQTILMPDGTKQTVIKTNLALEFVNVMYDYIYAPIKNRFSTNDDTHNDDVNMIHLVKSIEDTNVHPDLLFCLENKDNRTEKRNIESIIRKYNIREGDEKIARVCDYLMRHLLGEEKTNKTNKIYFINI